MSPDEKKRTALAGVCDATPCLWRERGILPFPLLRWPRQTFVLTAASAAASTLALASDSTLASAVFARVFGSCLCFCHSFSYHWLWQLLELRLLILRRLLLRLLILRRLLLLRWAVGKFRHYLYGASLIVLWLELLILPRLPSFLLYFGLCCLVGQ